MATRLIDKCRMTSLTLFYGPEIVSPWIFVIILVPLKINLGPLVQKNICQTESTTNGSIVSIHGSIAYATMISTLAFGILPLRPVILTLSQIKSTCVVPLSSLPNYFIMIFEPLL